VQYTRLGVSRDQDFPPAPDVCIVQGGPTEGMGGGGRRELQNGKSNQLKSERRSETPGRERKKDVAESGPSHPARLV
jgi:hypothetical protein